MDRYCKGCVYQTFEDTKNWGFCSCSEVPKGKQVKLNPHRNKEFDISDNYPTIALSKMRENSIPSCMLVQSFYDGNCPWFCRKDR